MSHWNRLLALGLIAVLCCCLGNPRLHPPLLAHTPRDEPKVKVLVPIVDIEAFHEVKDGTKFKLIEFPTKKTITSFDQIKGKISRHYTLKANEPIYQKDFREALTDGDYHYYQAGDVGHVLVIPREGSGGFINKGDRIDIEVTVLPQVVGDKVNTYFLLENIEVLDVNRVIQNASAPPDNQDRLLLRLTRPQSLTLKYFKDTAKAKVDIVKRKPGDPEVMPFAFALNPDEEMNLYLRMPKTPQQLILNQWLGVWQVTYKQLQSPIAPADKEGTAMESASRAIGGQYIQSTAAHSDQSVSRVTFTFDVQKNCYRAWWFSSTGQTSESTGTWNNDQKTMTWVSTGNPDAVTTNQQRFTDKDHMVWNVVTKDRTGKQLFHMEGKSTRKKPSQKE